MSGPIQWTPAGLVAAMTSTSSGVKAPVVTSLDDAQNEIDADDDDDVEADTPAPARTSQHARLHINTKAIPPALNVVKLARARLAQINVELRRLKKLEAEREELRRLLDAAKPRRRGVVRELKRPAG